jgi:hypothetical protein
MREIERDDGGPTLRVFKPHARVEYDFRDSGERGTMVLDDQGFCNPERDRYDLPKIDVIVIGDSFAWCIVLDPASTWTSQLGLLTQLSVFNLGRGGIGPYDYLQIFRHFGAPKHPDVVVMQIYEGNDLRDSIRYHEHVEAAREGRVLYADAADRSRRAMDYDSVLDNPIGRNSYAVNLLVVAVGEGVAGLVRAAAGDRREDEDFHYEFRFPERSVPMNVQNADESEVRSARRLKAGEIQLSAFDAALARFATMAREQGFSPLVTYAPSAYTAYAEYVVFEDESLQELMPWYSATQRQYLRARCQELGLPFFDLTPALQEAARALGPDHLLYYPINVHWTPEGNRAVAEALAPTVSSIERARGTGGAGSRPSLASSP